MRPLLITGILLGLTFSSGVYANWSAKQDGPDVFGATKVVAIASEGNSSLVIQCDDKDELYIAFLIEKEAGQEISRVPAQLLLQIDSGPSIHLDASTRAWNDKYAAIATEDRSIAVVSAIRSIQTARNQVNVGVKVNDVKESASFDTSGSTNAMMKVVAGCKLTSVK